MNATVTLTRSSEAHSIVAPKLGHVFERIRELIGEQAALTREVLECVKFLQQQCADQFQAEEESPLVQEVDEKAPWLAQQVSNLTGEHLELRRRLASLCRGLERHQPLPRCWEEFAEEFSFFERQLSAHESAEFDFWQEALVQEVGTKD
jgi:hemerythrin-like domain-containing protein